MTLEEKTEEEKKISREVHMKIRTSIEEKQTIKQKAAAAGVSLSAYVRECCLYGFVKPLKAIADIELIRELKQLGVNFNQYQHKLNALGKDTPEEVRRVALKIEKILDELQGIK